MFFIVEARVVRGDEVRFSVECVFGFVQITDVRRKPRDFPRGHYLHGGALLAQVLEKAVHLFVPFLSLKIDEEARAFTGKRLQSRLNVGHVDVVFFEAIQSRLKGSWVRQKERKEGG